MRSRFLRYGVALVAVAVATFLRMGLDPILGDRAAFTTYFAAIMFIAWYARLGPSILAIVLSAILAICFFIQPRGSLWIHDLEHQASFGLFLAVGVFIAILSELLHRDVSKRRRAEEMLKERTATLEQFSARLERNVRQIQQEEQSMKNLMELQDRERQLIGFEIHDGLAQLLVGAKMNLESFTQLQGDNPAAAKKALEAGIEALADGIKEARRLINALRPLSLDVAGVVDAIEDLVREVQGRGQCEIEFAAHAAFDRLPGPLENTIFRIVQESITNACRHSKSKRVRVELCQESNRVRIEVRDWGIGFDPQNVSDGRFGVQSIRERARVFGGQALIESCPGTGTRVVVELPLPSEKREVGPAGSMPP